MQQPASSRASCWLAPGCPPFDTDDEGMALANDTPFGLAASAWTTNTFRRSARAAHRGRLRADQRPHPHRVRDAARRLQGVGVGKDMSVDRSRIHQHQAHRPTSPARREGLAPHGLRRPLTQDPPTGATGRWPAAALRWRPRAAAGGCLHALLLGSASGLTQDPHAGSRLHRGDLGCRCASRR